MKSLMFSKREQATVEVTILQLETGGNLPPSKRRHIEQDKRLQKLKECMTDGTVSINEYVSAVAHLVGLSDFVYLKFNVYYKVLVNYLN